MSLFKKIFNWEPSKNDTEASPKKDIAQAPTPTASKSTIPQGDTDKQKLVRTGKLLRSKVSKKSNSVSKKRLQRKDRRAKYSAAHKHNPKAPKPSNRVAVFDTIIRPRITEKAALLNERKVYTFVVRKDATKQKVADAVEAKYKVRPQRIHLVAIPKKSKRIRIPGKEKMRGSTGKGKKAYVYLKEGDSITLT